MVKISLFIKMVKISLFIAAVVVLSACDVPFIPGI